MNAERPLRRPNTEGFHIGQRQIVLQINVRRAAAVEAMAVSAVDVQVRPRPGIERRFKADLEEAFPGEARIVTSDIRDRDEIYDAIKKFLGKGL